MPRLPWTRRRVALPEAAVRQAVARLSESEPETAVPIPLTVLPTNVATRLDTPRMFMVASSYLLSYPMPETRVTNGLLPGMAQPEVPRESAPTQSSTPSVRAMLPERWNVQAECPKRRIVVED